MKLIGDPHLGREFKHAPLHRRGEREATVRAEFRRQLQAGARDGLCICVGDLFENPNVSRETVKWAIDTVHEFAAEGSTLVFMAGNHDRSRQPGVVSAWDLFVRGVRGLPWVVIVEVPTVVWDVLCLPWEWGRSALEQLEGFDAQGATVAVCHHDLESFGGNDTHMLPARRLRELGVEEIHTGHWHLAGDYVVDGVTVHCTGSMLPYSHSEDPDELTYVTRNLDQIEGLDLHDKIVRIRAKRGDDIPEIDCLGLTIEWQNEDVDTLIVDTSQSFDLSLAITAAFDRGEVPTDVRDFINERL